MLNYKEYTKDQALKLFSFFILASLLIMTGVIHPAYSQEKSPLLETQQLSTIVATVNDDIITAADFRGRLNLALFSSGLPPKDEVLQNLSPQIMQSLINERLKLQETEAAGITVTEDAINQQIDTLSERNNISREDFLDKMRQANVPISSFKEQIKAEIAWAQYIQNDLRRKVDVSPSDVQTMMQKMRNRQGEKEYRLAEIFIEVSNPENTEKAKAFTMQLIDQAKQGAPFPQLARQFSASPSAAQNGEIGWVTMEDIGDPLLRQALTGLKKGELRGPIETNDGFYIIFMIDERLAPKVDEGKPQMKLSLKKIAAPDAEELRDAHTKIKGCLSMESFFKDYPSDQTGDIGFVMLNDLNPKLRTVLRDLEVSTLSPVIKEPEVFARYMICKKQSADTSPKVSEEDLINTIGNQQLELVIQQKIQQLRENAFIDIRI